MIRLGIALFLIGQAGESAVAQVLDLSFTPTMPFQGGALAIQDDGKIVVGDLYQTFAAFTNMRRFLPNGAVDSTFDHFGNAIRSTNNGNIASVLSVSCFMDGTVAISGTFDRIVLQNVPKIAKFDRAGNLISYPAPLTDAPGWLVAPQIAALPDNRAMIWGDFASVGPFYPRRGAALLTRSGALVGSFSPNPTSSSTGSSKEIDHRVVCMLRQPDGKFLISGEFDRIGGVSFPYLARVNDAGRVDSSFQPNPNGFCSNLALQPDGKILVTGLFSQIGGGFRAGIARLNGDGSLDPSFESVTNAIIYTLVIRADGKILIAGNFTTVNGQARSGVALLESNGALSERFGNAASANAGVAGLMIQEDGKALLAGSFSQIGGTFRSRLARMTPDVPAMSYVEVDDEGTELTWLRSGSVQEIENAEFRLSVDGTNFGTVLGKGKRVVGGWRLEDLKLPGNRTFYIQAKGLARGGYLNSSTSVMKSVTELFRPLPQVVSAPADQTVIAGAVGVVFSVEASSAATIVYQWKRNGRSIPGATSASYTIPGGVTSGHAGRYTCTMTSSAGAVTTAPATLTVITPITLVIQPLLQAVRQGKPAGFSVKVTGTSPQFKWFKDDVELPAFTKAVLRIPAADAGQHEGVYRVEVSNLAGTVSSVGVALYVVDAAPVATGPANSVFAVGQTVGAEIQADVVSESPALIQWLKNGKPVAKTPLAVLILAPVSLKSAGVYAVRASNPAGSVTSVVGDVAVVDQTPKRTVVATGGTANLTAIAAGAHLEYRWRKGSDSYLVDGPSVSGALTQTLTLANLSAADAGDYICEVTAAGGTLDAGTQSLFVCNAAPEILVPLVLPQAMLSADYDFLVPLNANADLAVANVTAKGLPPGLRISSTGRITGRPTKLGTFLVSLTPSNPSGIGVTVSNLTLQVVEIPSVLVGSFVAFVPGDRTSPLFRLGARLDLTITPKGGYSGRLALGGLTVRFAGGRLNVGVGLNGLNTLTIPRKGAAPLTLAFQLDEVEQTLTGSISGSDETGTLEGWRNGWSKVSKAEQYRGYYTTALQGPAPVVGAYGRPDGDGFSTFTVSDVGLARLVCKLPDGTAFTTACFVGQGGQLALYAPLYRPTGGLVNGILAVTPSGAAPAYLENSVAGDVQWYKFPLFAGLNYAAGFDAVSMVAMGAKYTPVPNGNILGSVPSAIEPDVAVQFEGAKIEQEMAQSPNVQGRMSVTSQFLLPAVGPSNPAGTRLKLNPRTGLFSGAFTLKTKRINNPALATQRTAAVFGVIVRNGSTATGAGFGALTLPQSPGLATAEILSGRVSVSVP